MSKTPLLAMDSRQLGMEKAAWLLEDATNGEKPDVEYPEDLMSARQDYYTCLRAERWCRRAVWGLVFVTILEVPSWCRTATHEWTWMAPEDRCPAPGGKPIYLSGLTYWPPGVTVCIELVLILILLRKYLLDRRLELTYWKPMGLSYNDMRKAKFGIAMGIMALCDIAIFWVFRPHFRIAFLARCGFLCLLPAVMSLGSCVLAVLNEFLSVAIFLIGTMGFFGWIAVTIFHDMDVINAEGDRVNDGLESFGAACYSMFVAGTSDDFVDVFLPTYVHSRASGLLWLAFLVIVQLLFLNLVLDTLVAAYTKYTESKTEEKFASQIEGIVRAFKTLCEAVCPAGEDEIKLKDFLDFCGVVSKSPRMPDLSQSTAEIMFNALDTDGSGYMSQEEFVDICGAFQYKFWVTKRDSFIGKSCLPIWNSGWFTWFREAVWSGGFDAFMNCVLALNFILVATEAEYDLNNWEEPKWMTKLDLVFSLSYAGEVFAKLSVYSFEEYWSEPSNQFDFWTTWLLLSTCLLQGVLSRYANILRLLRLLRVLKQLKTLKSVQFMMATIQQLVICSKDILTLLGVVVYFFTSLGIQLWGGLLYNSNPQLAGSEYLKNKWAVLNFNDFPSGFGLWVVMLLCEYVAPLADAVSRTSPTPGTWLIFPLFYICAVSIVFELVKAFTIEVFIDLHEKKDEEPEPEFEGLEETEKTFLERGEVLHFRPLGDISTREKLKEAYQEFLEAEEEGHHGGHKSNGNHHNRSNVIEEHEH